MEHPPGWFDWAYKGVDHSFPGNGGVECRDFLSFSQRCWESILASLVAGGVLLYAAPRLRLPRDLPCGYSSSGEPMGKRLLLLLMCLTFGIELGFKLATRQMIWIGNPCHLTTMLQIFILAAPPSRIVTAAFRLHLHMLTGAPIAILFPVINTRLLPFETGVYFLQHILMLIIPFYLMNHGDPFIPERLLDFNWALVSFGFLFIYHFLPLQMLAYISQVNLNNMLCPAVSDPFHGKYYRLFAIAHQLILIPTLGKIFVLLAKAFNILPDCSPPETEAAISKIVQCSPAKKLCSSGCSTRPAMKISSSGCSTEPTSTDSCLCNSDYDSGFANNKLDASVHGNRSESAVDLLYDGGTAITTTDGGGEKDSCCGDRCRDEQQWPDSEASCGCVGDDVGEEQNSVEDGGQVTFVTRRLVNGKIIPKSDCAGHTPPCKQQSSCGHCNQERSQERPCGAQAGSDRPMTMRELSTSNGHAKTH